MWCYVESDKCTYTVNFLCEDKNGKIISKALNFARLQTARNRLNNLYFDFDEQGAFIKIARIIDSRGICVCDLLIR